MTRPSLAGIEKRAEVFRLHVPVSRCDTWEHGSSCPGAERCKNCRRRWPCTFITDARAAHLELTAAPSATRDEVARSISVGAVAARLDLTDPEGDPT